MISNNMVIVELKCPVCGTLNNIHAGHSDELIQNGADSGYFVWSHQNCYECQRRFTTTDYENHLIQKGEY